MGKLAIIALTLLFLPIGTSADCVDVSSSDRWSRVNSHKIILFDGDEPLALLTIPFYFISSTSEIRLIDTFICDWDEIIIDDEVCEIQTVKRL